MTKRNTLLDQRTQQLASAAPSARGSQVQMPPDLPPAPQVRAVVPRAAESAPLAQTAQDWRSRFVATLMQTVNGATGKPYTQQEALHEANQVPMGRLPRMVPPTAPAQRSTLPSRGGAVAAVPPAGMPPVHTGDPARDAWIRSRVQNFYSSNGRWPSDDELAGIARLSLGARLPVPAGVMGG